MSRVRRTMDDLLTPKAAKALAEAARDPPVLKAESVVGDDCSHLRVKLDFDNSIRMIRFSKKDNLQALEQVIRRTFNDLQGSMVVKYEDAEGDSITVASDEDLILALESNSVPKFKIQMISSNENEANLKRPLCKLHLEGYCRFGSKCKFLHSSGTACATMNDRSVERWLKKQMKKPAAENIEFMSSSSGLEVLHNIANYPNLSDNSAAMLVKLLVKNEIRSSMMKQDTNKIYGSLMGTLFLEQIHRRLSCCSPAFMNLEPLVLLFEELQLRTSDGWKCLPLDAIKALIDEMQQGNVNTLSEKVGALLEHRRKMWFSSAVSIPDQCLVGAGFRNLPIIPTKEELLTTGQVLVPMNKVGVRYTSVAEYLETHFRLLREDFIEPLRKGIKAYQNGGEHFQDLQVYMDVHLKGIKFTENGIESRVSFRPQNREVQFDWMESNRMMFGSLLCITQDKFENIIWGTVVGRDKLREGVVDIQLLDGSEIEATGKYVMVESKTAYFEPYSHVLRNLQREDMEMVPFAEHLVSLKPQVDEPAYIMEREEEDVYNVHSVFPKVTKELGEPKFHVLREWPQWTSTLDSSQKAALKHALTKRLALIQGPPGTGKTFIGLLIVNLLLQNLKFPETDSEDVADLKGPILIVCYTNHALDQFMEGIYKSEAKIVRIGGRCKSKMLEDCILHNLLAKNRRARPHARAADNARIVQQQLKTDISRCVEVLNLEFVTRELLHGVATEEQIEVLFSNLDNFKDGRVVEGWLERLDGNSKTARHVRSDGWLPVAKRRRRERDDYRRDEPGREVALEGDLHAFFDRSNVWSLSIGARKKLHKYWLDEIHRNAQVDLNRLTQEYVVSYKQSKEADSEMQLSLLRKMKVIGMTTTAAARLHDLLVSLKPEIVIVKEAAEVLESHVIACLSPFTKHLILIGDHMQLRPSVATYKLAVKHRLDVSMFERLISSGIDHCMLQVQRRMKPCISKLISGIYPGLKNHSSVMKYDEVKGMSSSLFFLDHSSAEEIDQDSVSKVNIYEARFMVELCGYLLNQHCYKPSDITILAMYKGQVEEIKKRLKDRLKFLSFAVYSDTAENELSRMPRVSTVDDFQGEESNIVLLSLVRSNSVQGKDGAGTIGFLNISNRACVALSRARIGMYILGNAQLLSSRSTLWKDIIQNLSRDGLFGSKLVLCCQNHSDVKTEIQQVKDFKQVEDGGCSKPCEYQLECGHVCPRRCHPGSHDTVVCPKRCYKRFSSCPHRCKEICHANRECGPCKEPVKKLIKRCGHSQLIACSENTEKTICLNECSKILSCGHQCAKQCANQCACHATILKKLPCGHKAMIKCSEDPALVFCTQPCRTILSDCKHLCQGTCGKCMQGTRHLPCQRKCGRILSCGHQCKANCSIQCPPCSLKCEKCCVHSKCSRPCSALCIPCREPCSWRCQHYKCDLLCYEACVRPRCDHPCRKRLACGHPCIGLCGEPCPRKCRICQPYTLDVISQTTLKESEPSDRFVELLDCHHIFEVSGLDQWMDIDDSSNAILLKFCPACKTPVRRTFRYANIVKKKLQQVEEVKKRVYAYSKVESGNNKLNKKEYDAAREAFLAAITILPGLLEAHVGVAQALCYMKEFSNAMTHLAVVIERSNKFRSAIRMFPKIPLTARYSPLPKHFRFTSNAKDVLAETALLQMALALADGFKMFPEAIKLCDVILNQNKTNQKAIALKKQLEHGRLTVQVVEAVSLEFASRGRWYQCPNGHVYVVGECGGPMQVSRCPDCQAVIGGTSHTPAAGNTHSSIDGSTRPLYSSFTL